MPGRVHYHEGIRVYHRKDGALTFHKVKHSRYMPGRDAKIKTKHRPPKKGYPHAGDGTPKHKGKNRKFRAKR